MLRRQGVDARRHGCLERKEEGVPGGDDHDMKERLFQSEFRRLCGDIIPSSAKRMSADETLDSKAKAFSNTCFVHMLR